MGDGGAHVTHAPVANSLSEGVITPAKWYIQKQKAQLLIQLCAIFREIPGNNPA